MGHEMHESLFKNIGSSGIPESQELMEIGIVEKQLRDNTGKNWKYKKNLSQKSMILNYPNGTIFFKRGNRVDVYEPDGWEFII